jgi:hypothetical protein
VAELEYLSNVSFPRWLLRNSELRGRLIQYGKSSPEAARVVEDPLNGLENSIKVRRKQLDALLDERLMQQKRQEEAALRAKVAADPALAKTLGDPWASIATAQQRQAELYLPYVYLEQVRGAGRQLARTPLWLRTHAGARRGRAPQAQHAASARVCQRQRPAARVAATHAPAPVYPELEAQSLV